MSALRVVGEIDEQGQLVASVPSTVKPGKVELLIVGTSASGDEVEDDWMSAVAAEWEDDLADPRQDIYSLADGVPIE